MDQLAGLAPDSPLALLRRQRPDVVRHLQGSDEAIFAPRDDGGLTVAERAAAALRIAVLLRDARLQSALPRPARGARSPAEAWRRVRPAAPPALRTVGGRPFLRMWNA